MDVHARTVSAPRAAGGDHRTEFDVAMCLIESRGRAMPRDEIFQHVLGTEPPWTPRTIDNFIQQLRAKLEPDPVKPNSDF